jgi:hypothetical protein
MHVTTTKSSPSNASAVTTPPPRFHSDLTMSGPVVPPRYGRPHTFVDVVADDLCHHFDGRLRPL